MMLISDLKRAVELMREQSIKPYVIKTEEEAADMTMADPTDHKWKVGDEYYAAKTIRKNIYI